MQYSKLLLESKYQHCDILLYKTNNFTRQKYLKKSCETKTAEKNPKIKLNKQMSNRSSSATKKIQIRLQVNMGACWGSI